MASVVESYRLSFSVFGFPRNPKPGTSNEAKKYKDELAQEGPRASGVGGSKLQLNMCVCVLSCPEVRCGAEP